MTLVALAVPVAGEAGERDALPTLVVDTTFTIVTADPQRSFDATASLVERPVYDTLLTYRSRAATDTGSLAGALIHRHRSRPEPGPPLRHGVRFADDTPLTAADVVFSFAG